MSDDIPTCSCDSGRRLDEYRAEVRAVRLVLQAVEQRTKRTGVLVEYTISDNKARWLFTCSDRGGQRILAQEMAEYITTQIGDALRLVGLIVHPAVVSQSGSDAEAPAETTP